MTKQIIQVMKNFGLIIAISIIICGEHLESKELTRINVFVMRLTNYYPFYVALEKGFFKEEGIEINFVTPPIEMAGAIDSQGRITEWKKDAVYEWINKSKGMAADVYIGLWLGEYFKIEVNQKDILRIFMLSADTVSHYATFILVKKNSPIKSVLELEGKKIVCDQHEFGYLLMKYYLKDKGVSAYYILDMPGPEKEVALISGKIDAICAGEPRTSMFIQKGIAEILARDPFNDISKLSIGSPPLRLFAISSNFVNKNPNKAKSFKKAIQKGLTYSQKHHTEARLILSKYIIGLNDEIVSNVKFAEIIENIDAKYKKKMQQLADLYYNEKCIDKHIDINKLRFF